MNGAASGGRGTSSLDVFDFGVLLQALAQSQKEGSLRVVSGPKEKFLCLREGRVDAILTPRSPLRIGRILYNARALEIEDLRRVLDARRRGELPGDLGETLVAEGLVTPEALREAVQYQMAEELLEVFYWRDLSYEFLAGPPDKTLGPGRSELTRVAGSMDANSILLMVTKLIDDLDKFNQATPSLRDVYELTRDPEEYIERETDANRVRCVLDLIDGQRDMGDVVREARLNRFEVMEIFYLLRQEGFIRPKNAFELFMLAESLRDTLPAAKRARLFERIAELGVEGFDVALRLAQVYEELDRKADAARHFLEHARQKESEGRLEDAEQAISEAIRVAPEETSYREHRAGLLLRLERPEEAAGELLRVARLEIDAREADRAGATLDWALTLAPRDEALLLARSDVSLLKGGVRAAANTLIEVARLRVEERDLAGARQVLERAIAIAPRQLRPRRLLAELLVRSADREAAAEAVQAMVPVALDRMKRRPARGARVLDALVRRLEREGAHGSAAMVAVGEGYLRLCQPARARRVLVGAGESRIASGDWRGAREVYALACRAWPSDLDLAETLALINAQVGNREQALARLRGIAEQYRERGDAEHAEKAWREILRLNPFSPEAHLALADLNEERGERGKAAGRLHKVGQLHCAAGNLEAAVEHLERACRLDPSRPEYVRTLADCLEKVLRTERSLETLDGLLAMLRARQDHTAAVDVAFRILDLEPENDVASRALCEAWRELGRSIRARTVREGAVRG